MDNLIISAALPWTGVLIAFLSADDLNIAFLELISLGKYLFLFKIVST